jgi:hypothetical protein
MSTVPFPRIANPALIQRSAKDLPSLSPGSATATKADLTIHRITKTHHGRTLLTLGHASEYLANSRRYSIAELDDRSDEEAIHILLGLSRMVFDEFAEQVEVKRRPGTWLVERVVRLFE